MAHINIDERRARMNQLIDNGMSRGAITRICSSEFGCSPQTIYADLHGIGYQVKKKAKRISGIYGIMYLDRVYVGCSNNIKRRWSMHKQKLLDNIHHCEQLQNAFLENGGDFNFFIITECPADKLFYEEYKCISYFKSIGLNLYNTYVYYLHE